MIKWGALRWACESTGRFLSKQGTRKEGTDRGINGQMEEAKEGELISISNRRPFMKGMSKEQYILSLLDLGTRHLGWDWGSNLRTSTF